MKKRRSAANLRDSRLAWLFVTLTYTAMAAAVITPASLDQEIEAKGAKEVVSRLNSGDPGAADGNDWTRVMKMMSAGQADYIALAPKLAPGTDAGTSEDLGISLAHALPLAPIATLRVIDLKGSPALGVSRVCGAPFIEDTVKDMPGYIRSARASVSRVSIVALKPVKNACMKQLNATAKQLSSAAK